MIDLSALYRNWGEWEDAYCKLADRLAALLNLRGTPLTQGHQLLERYRKACDLWESQGRLYCYAKLQRDADAREETAGGAFQRLAQKLADMEAETAWFAADIAQVPQATLLDWCMQTPDLQAYEVPALEIHRSRAHRLDEASERLIARAEPALRGTLRAYEALSTHVASQWTVELCDGSAVQLTPAKYRELLEHDPEQENRRRASEGCHQRYIEQGPAFAALYAGILQKDFFHSQSRSFPSCLAAATFRDAIPESCVRALIVETRSIRSVFQRYLKLRKRLLRVSEYHLYDNSVRLYCPERALSANLDMPQVICDSVALMGSIYSRNLSDLFEKGCIDYLDRSGKARGAYCLSAYGVPPFIIASLTPSLTSEVAPDVRTAKLIC